MRAPKEFPRLYGLATNKKIKTVLYYIEELEDGTANIVNEHGYLDGKKQTDRRNIKAGKNIGRANETTIWDQAMLEAESKWKKKLDKNYTTNRSGEVSAKEKALLPMAAGYFWKKDKEGREVGRAFKIIYPCYVQPKLNGVKCLSTMGDEITYGTKGGKVWTTLEHLDKNMNSVFGHLGSDVHPDGEIYKHGLTLQEINRRVKKYRPGFTEELEYWVYDLAVEDITNEGRINMLNGMFRVLQNGVDIKVVQVETQTANSEKEVREYHDKYVAEGFEGAMVRQMDGIYKFGGSRCDQLQKVKDFMDDEFEIVNVYSGEGRETGAIIFTLKVKDPVEGGATEFSARPLGSIPERVKDMLRFNQHPEEFIGLPYKVRFFEYSEDNVPSGNTVGLGIRLPE